jgi:hypothetical protein
MCGRFTRPIARPKAGANLRTKLFIAAAALTARALSQAKLGEKSAVVPPNTPIARYWRIAEFAHRCTAFHHHLVCAARATDRRRFVETRLYCVLVGKDARKHDGLANPVGTLDQAEAVGIASATKMRSEKGVWLLI